MLKITRGPGHAIAEFDLSIGNLPKRRDLESLLRMKVYEVRFLNVPESARPEIDVVAGSLRSTGHKVLVGTM
jgi:hypothetical protein